MLCDYDSVIDFIRWIALFSLYTTWQLFFLLFLSFHLVSCQLPFCSGSKTSVAGPWFSNQGRQLSTTTFFSFYLFFNFFDFFDYFDFFDFFDCFDFFRFLLFFRFLGVLAVIWRKVTNQMALQILRAVQTVTEIAQFRYMVDTTHKRITVRGSGNNAYLVCD